MSEYTKQYNGRINIMGPNTGDVFQLYDRIPVDKKANGCTLDDVSNTQTGENNGI